MRRKDLDLPIRPATAPLDELRRELEGLGLTPADAAPLAEQLAHLARELPEPEYRALLEGVLLGRRADASSRASGPELHNLLDDFASELKKLDEGLRLLAAYLVRLKEQSQALQDEAPRTLH